MERLYHIIRVLWTSLTRFGRMLWYYLSGLYNRVNEHHVFLLAGGLAFSVIVCIIPMVLIVFAGLGAVLERPSITEEIKLFIERAIPYADYASYVEELVFSRVEEFTFYKNLAGLIGIVGLLFASSGLFSSMRTALNTVFRIQSDESVFIGKLRDLGLILMVLVYFLLSTTILPGLGLIQEFAYKSEIIRSTGLDFLGDLALQAASLAVIFGVFFLIYFSIPHRRLPIKVILTSGLSAAILWHVAQELFGFYIANFITFKRVYGAYFLMIVVAFWIYYSSLVLILGAEIGQLFRERGGQGREAGS
ncbi:MAG: YihY/virulence factor BrkB family protein [FCB group bacterium]|nr:YihY/virulence factor BrkB family protein [FCB group bacterium]